MSEMANLAESSGLEFLQHLWNFHLFSVDGSPITLGKVFIGVILLVLGYFAASTSSRAVGRRVLRRFEIQVSLRHTIERFLFYVFYILIVLFILQMLSIPVTVFSFIGGALALGIGFGSQNVVNNFISGLIVMVEQPVRVGDWVEIDGVFGQVEVIGGRSTRMRAVDSKQTIIPNSFFLEKTVLNWTLSDALIGGSVKVGVAYGTNAEKVRSILLQVAQEHPDVVKDQAPFVYFQDFGESSLDFELFYKIQFSDTVTARRVASDLRYRIEAEFAKNNISIPYPHRQLLLDSSLVDRLSVKG